MLRAYSNLFSAHFETLPASKLLSSQGSTSLALIEYIKIQPDGYLLDTDTVVNSAESLKDEETSILYKIIQTSNQEEIID